MKSSTRLLLALFCFATAGSALAKAQPTPAEWEGVDLETVQKVQELTDAIEAANSPRDRVGLYSQRGDVYFFLGRFKDAQRDYLEMVKLDPSLDESHWRLGIAHFYAGDFKAAAAQFDKYNSFDNVDRENGIWRYFSHFKALGKEAARKELLKYEKDDREPFPSVYKLFAGEMTGEEILASIKEAKIGDAERAKRYFYAHLYIGLNAAIEGNDAVALENLKKSNANEWGKAAGYGPNYMWHVGRLQSEILGKAESGKPKAETGNVK